jgi:hypothetical protein
MPLGPEGVSVLLSVGCDRVVPVGVRPRRDQRRAAVAHQARGARRLERLIARVLLDLFDLNHGREHFANLVGHLGQAVDILV